MSPPSSFVAVRHGPCMLIEKSIQALESKCLRKLLCISYLEHKTNDWVQSKINFFTGPQELLLATVKRWKLTYFGHVMCHDSLSILQCTLEGVQHCGQERKCWMDNLKEWTSLPMSDCLQQPHAEKTERGYLMYCLSCPPTPHPQPTQPNGSRH